MTEPRPGGAAIWLLTAVALAASLSFLVVRLVGPNDGAVIEFYTGAWGPDGVAIRTTRGADDALRSGDVVTAVGGRPLAEWLDRSADSGLDRSGALSGAVVYSVRRDGAALDVRVPLGAHDSTTALLDNWSAILFTVVLQVVAAFVLVRRPGAPASSALALAAIGVTGSTVPWLLGITVSDVTRGWPFLLYGATAGGLYMLLWPAGALHLPLALTSTTGPSRRALVIVYAVPLAAYLAIMAALRLTAASSTSWLGMWPLAQGVVIVPALVVGLAITVARIRAAPEAVRVQARWVAIGGGLSVVASLVLLFGPQLLTGQPILPWHAVGLVSLPLPLGIAAGILRDRLFDIDVVVNRALVYGGVSAAIVAIYVASVTFIGNVLGLQRGFSASLLATGLAAVVALPVRDRLQRVVNRLMYGDRDDPYRALTRLGRRLEGMLDPLEAPVVIVRTVAESLRLPWVQLRIGEAAGGGRTIDHGDRPRGDPITIPLAYGPEVAGALLVAPRSPAEPLSAADRKLLDALAIQIGAAVHALALTLDLVESRERLVAAREEERRRIRRDLHDGLGPTLAAIGLRAEVAADLAARDAPGAQRVLEELRIEVRGALADIRRLVDALRPPALDELGLVGALREQATRLGPEPTIEVDADVSLAELPAAVEVAAYRISVEAMTNAARHSGARSCRVRLREARNGTGRSLEVDVMDDGRGFASGARSGIGLASMRERAAEVGGTFAVERAEAGGTRVIARLPLGDPVAPGAPHAGTPQPTDEPRGDAPGG